MISYYKKYLTVLIGLFSFYSIGMEEESWPFSVETAEQAVFKLELFDSSDDSGQGTGFVVELDNEYYFITNFHVIKDVLDSDYYLIQNEKGISLTLENIEGLSLLYDLAFFKIKEEYKGPALKLSDKNKNYRRAYSIGYPRGNLTKDILIQVNEIDSLFFYGLWSSFQAMQGISGGPVLNEKGQVIGVHSRGDGHGELIIKPHLIKLLIGRKTSDKSLEQRFYDEISRVEQMAKKGNPTAQYVFANYFRDKKLEKFNSVKNEGSFVQNTLALFPYFWFGQKELKFYKASASQNHFKSQVNLALKYFLGTDVNQNIKESVKLLRLAVKHNKSHYAKLILANVLIHGFLLKVKSFEDKKIFLEALQLLKELDEMGLKSAKRYLVQILNPLEFDHIMKIPTNEVQSKSGFFINFKSKQLNPKKSFPTCRSIFMNFKQKMP